MSNGLFLEIFQGRIDATELGWINIYLSEKLRLDVNLS